jgi:hypothetical protein
MELEEKSPTSYIYTHLNGKYQGELIVNAKMLATVQNEYLKEQIKSKTLHSLYMEYLEEEDKDTMDSVTMLTHGNIAPRDEAMATFLQDRNVYYGEKRTCAACKSVPRTVDHVASRCTLFLPKMTLRHNEVIKCIHKSLCIKYKFSKDKRIKLHMMQKVIENQYAKITTDSKAVTERPLEHKRPDIVLTDRIQNKTYIIDVTICGTKRLLMAEQEKRAKYEVLAREKRQQLGHDVEVLPYAMTWDGMVSHGHREIRKLLGVSERIHAYTQQVVLRHSADMALRDVGRELHVVEGRDGLIDSVLAVVDCSEDQGEETF